MDVQDATAISTEDRGVISPADTADAMGGLESQVTQPSAPTVFRASHVSFCTLDCRFVRDARENGLLDPFNLLVR
jgi:hypothetical protein